MLCRKPFQIGTAHVGCGQCLSCRVNRRRVWTWRCMLESMCHDGNCFVTLTYSDDCLPAGGTLVPRDLKLWLKRFRKKLDCKVRFFAVGEYGEESFRPHYHLSVFGVGPEVAPIVADTWKFGFSSCYEFTAETAQYVCGYVLKKLTQQTPILEGRHPEFARMSNRPGIGAPAMAFVGEQLFTPEGVEEVVKTGDVPMQLKMGKRSMPLGRYLRRKLREEVDLPESWKEAIKSEWQEESAGEALRLVQEADEVGQAWISLASLLVLKNLGRIRSVEARSKIKRRRKL